MEGSISASGNLSSPKNRLPFQCDFDFVSPLKDEISGKAHSRKVLAWRLSNTLDSGFCVDCLEQALQAYDTSEIFNTDKGCHNQ